MWILQFPLLSRYNKLEVGLYPRPFSSSHTRPGEPIIRPASTGSSSARSIIGNAGESQTITVAVTHDATHELDETFVVAFSAVSGTTLGSSMSAAAPFKIDSEAMLTLKSLWIKDSSSAANGGADYNEGTGNIITSPLSGNTAGAAGTSGGTIYNAADNVTVVNSPLSGNTANAAGGAIDNNGCSLQTASSRQTRVQEMPEDILKAFFAGHSECSMGPVGDLTRPQVRGVSMDGGKVNIWKKLNFHCVADLILFAIR